MTDTEDPSPTVNSRDGQWTYHRLGCGRVNAIAHRPSGTRVAWRGSLETARAMARSGALTDLLNEAHPANGHGIGAPRAAR